MVTSMQSTPLPEKTTAKKQNKTKQEKQKRKTEKNKVYHWKFPKIVNPHG